jgi:hypothetical protein
MGYKAENIKQPQIIALPREKFSSLNYKGDLGLNLVYTSELKSGVGDYVFVLQKRGECGK